MGRLTGQDDDVTTPFDNPRAELAWMFLQSLCEGGDPDEGFALLSDDFSHWSALTHATLDKATLRQEIARRQQRVEATLDLLRCINEGDSVVIEAQGHLVTPRGVPYQIPYLFIFETRDGLITSLREYGDTRLQAEVLGAPAGT